MKLIELLAIIGRDTEVVIKHMISTCDSQHYLYRGTVESVLLCPQFPYYNRRIYKVVANSSAIIIMIY
jgi:hypothetical protein